MEIDCIVPKQLYLSGGVAAANVRAIEAQEIAFILVVAPEDELALVQFSSRPVRSDKICYLDHPLPDKPDDTFDLLSHIEELNQEIDKYYQGTYGES
jgi:hypothetical protein